MEQALLPALSWGGGFAVPCSKAELPREVLLPDWSPKNISLKLGTAHSAGNPLGCGKTQMVCLGVSWGVSPHAASTDQDQLGLSRG